MLANRGVNGTGSLKAPFPYFGGKSRVADIVWQRFGDPDNYVEPFAGSLAVLLMRPTAPQTETVNDIDCYLANFWRAIAGDPEGVAEYADWPVNEADLHARHQWLVDQLEFRERMKREPHFFDAKIAGWWVWGISSSIGDGWCRHTRLGSIPHLAGSKGVHRQIPHLRNEGMGIHRQLNGVPHLGDQGTGIHRQLPSNDRHDGLRQYFQELNQRLRRVRVCCGDWTRVLGPSVTFRHGVTAMFLDPPYDSYESVYGDGQEHLSTAVRQWAIENGDNPLLRICLCGYAEEHASVMPEDWECVAWTANGGYGNQGENYQNKFRERLWFSPACLRPQENFFYDPEWAETALEIG